MNKSSQPFVNSNLNNIDAGIIAPMAMPKYLKILIPFFSSMAKNSYSPRTVTSITVITKPA